MLICHLDENWSIPYGTYQHNLCWVQGVKKGDTLTDLIMFGLDYG